MDGTALFLSVASIFIAQMTGKILGFGELVTVLLTSTVASMSSASVPSAALVLLMVVLTAIDAPVQSVSLLFAVDWLVWVLFFLSSISAVSGNLINRDIFSRTAIAFEPQTICWATVMRRRLSKSFRKKSWWHWKQPAKGHQPHPRVNISSPMDTQLIVIVRNARNPMRSTWISAVLQFNLMHIERRKETASAKWMTSKFAVCCSKKQHETFANILWVVVLESIYFIIVCHVKTKTNKMNKKFQESEDMIKCTNASRNINKMNLYNFAIFSKYDTHCRY